MKEFGIKKIYNFDGSYQYQLPTDYAEQVRTNVQDSKKLWKCGWCDKNISQSDFTDELSWKEYQLSALCQECQDGEFNDLLGGSNEKH